MRTRVSHHKLDGWMSSPERSPQRSRRARRRAKKSKTQFHFELRVESRAGKRVWHGGCFIPVQGLALSREIALGPCRSRAAHEDHVPAMQGLDRSDAKNRGGD